MTCLRESLLTLVALAGWLIAHAQPACGLNPHRPAELSASAQKLPSGATVPVADHEPARRHQL